MIEPLTPYQHQVLSSLANGNKPKEIARSMDKTDHAIFEVIKSVRRKLKAKTTEQAIAMLAREGVI